MRSLKLIDIEVSLPAEVTLAEHKPERGVVLYVLIGRSAEQVREQIEAMGTARGYELLRTPNASHLLRRRSQRINIFGPQPERLDITVDDPEALPLARVDEHGIVLGPLSVAINAEQIVPQRERHDEGSTMWSAEWHVYGREPEQLASEIHGLLLQRGLRSNGIWPPPKGGIPQWHVEAYSHQRLVKVYIMTVEGHIVLSVTLIDHAG